MSFRGPAEATCKCGWRKTYPSFVAAQFGVDAHQRFGCWYWGKRECVTETTTKAPPQPPASGRLFDTGKEGSTEDEPESRETLNR